MASRDHCPNAVRDMIVVGWRYAGTHLIDFQDPDNPRLVDTYRGSGDTWEWGWQCGGSWVRRDATPGAWTDTRADGPSETVKKWMRDARSAPMDPEDPREEIDARLTALQAAGDWRGGTLAHLRSLIKEADPDIVEEIKWRKPSNPAGVPTYSHEGLIGTLEHYKEKVKFTFAKGGQLDDPKGVFTGGFGGARRVVDLFEGDTVDDAAFQDLIRAAVALNRGN